MTAFPWLWLKIFLLVAGVGIGLVGLARNDRPMVWTAVGFLAAAFLARFPERRQR